MTQSVTPDLSARVGSVLLKNPVMSASGTFGYGLEFMPFYDISRLGAVIVKGLSLLPTPGNPPGRIVETPAGMLNAIGLQNIGVERFVNEVAPRLDDAAPCTSRTSTDARSRSTRRWRGGSRISPRWRRSS